MPSCTSASTTPSKVLTTTTCEGQHFRKQLIGSNDCIPLNGCYIVGNFDDIVFYPDYDMDVISSGDFVHYYLSDGTCNNPADCCYPGACDITDQPWTDSYWFGSSSTELWVVVYACNYLLDDLYIDGYSYFVSAASTSRTPTTSPSMYSSLTPSSSSINSSIDNSIGKRVEIFIIVSIVVVIVGFIAVVGFLFCCLTKRNHEELNLLREIEVN